MIQSLAWLKAGIIILFFLAEASMGLAWRGILPIPLPPTVLMLAPAVICLVALLLLELELGFALITASFLVPLTVFSFGSFSFGPMPFLVLLLFGLYLVRGLVKERELRFDAPGAVPLLMLVGASILSVGYAYVVQDPHLPQGRDWAQGHWWIGYQAMGIFLFAYTLMVYVVTANGLKSRTWLWAVYICAVAVCTCVVVSPLPRHLANFAGLTQMFREGGRLVESASGTAAMLLALLTLSLALHVRRTTLRIALGALFAVALLNLILSYYLNTWLGFAAGVAIIIFKRSKGLFWILVVLGLLGAFLAADLIQLIREQRFSTPGSGDLRRLDIWTSCIRVWLKRPVLGVGTANLASAFLAYGTPTVAERVVWWNAAHPHNTYAGILAENGLLGLGSMLGLIVAYVRNQWRSINLITDEALKGLATASLAVFVASATTAMFASGLLPIYSGGGAGSGNVNGMAFNWILFAIGVAAARIEKCESA